jgi:hypothetical protein
MYNCCEFCGLPVAVVGPKCDCVRETGMCCGEDESAPESHCSVEAQGDSCDECGGALSQCGPPSPNGEPTLDCLVCLLRLRLENAHEDVQNMRLSLSIADEKNARLERELDEVRKSARPEATAVGGLLVNVRVLEGVKKAFGAIIIEAESALYDLEDL